MYKEWADVQIQKIKDILNTARAGHADAVKSRIEDVKPLSNVVEITKQLFEVSKVGSKATVTCTRLTNTKGNRQARGSSFRVRAEDSSCSRSKVRPRLMGKV